MTDSVTGALNFLQKYWAIIAAIAVLLAGNVETRVKVAQLSDNAMSERGQDQQISGNSVRLTTLEEWRRSIDKVVTPEAQQDYGALLSTVKDHTRRIENLER